MNLEEGRGGIKRLKIMIQFEMLLEDITDG